MGTELVRDLEIVQIIHAFEGQKICGQQKCAYVSKTVESIGQFVRSDAFLIAVTGGRHVGDAPPSTSNE